MDADELFKRGGMIIASVGTYRRAGIKGHCFPLLPSRLEVKPAIEEFGLVPYGKLSFSGMVSQRRW